MRIKKFFDWRNKNRSPKIEDRFYTVDLWKYLDLNITDEVEDVFVEKITNKKFSVNIKFSSSFINSYLCQSGLLPSIKDDVIYRFILNVNGDNRVINIQLSRPPAQVDIILDKIGQMIRKYLTDNNNIVVHNYGGSGSGTGGR